MDPGAAHGSTSVMESFPTWRRAALDDSISPEDFQIMIGTFATRSQGKSDSILGPMGNVARNVF